MKTLAPPPLQTLLDLTATEHLREVESHSPELDVMMLLAREEDRHANQVTDALTVRDQMFGESLADLPFAAQVLVKRLATMAPAARYSAPLAGFVTAACGQNPAKAVMWAHAFAAWWARTGTPATVRGLLLKHYDGWLPTEAGLRVVWDGQKIERETLREMRKADPFAMDNWLDAKEAWSHEALKSGAAAESS